MGPHPSSYPPVWPWGAPAEGPGGVGAARRAAQGGARRGARRGATVGPGERDGGIHWGGDTPKTIRQYKAPKHYTKPQKNIIQRPNILDKTLKNIGKNPKS